MRNEFDELWRQAQYYSNDNIVKDSCPILYFGNYREYRASEIKIITVGINPSKSEFPESDKYQRFPRIRSGNWSEYLEAFNCYFEENPYKNWFNSYEKVLNELKGSYYPDPPQKKYPYRVLHTDICSPLATDPAWSELSKNIQQEMKREGIPLWHELIRILKPDIIISSFAKGLLNEIPFRIVEDWKRIHSIKKKAKGEPRKQPYYVKKAKVRIDNRLAYIFWGNQCNTPFGNISDEDKIKVGNVIAHSISNSLN